MNNNNNNNKTNNKNNSSSKRTNNIRNTISNVVKINESTIVFIVFGIMMAFMVYTIYNYYSSDFGLNPSKTYYGRDLLKYEPIFRDSSENIKDCIEKCELDPLCSGITYDNEEKLCVGTKDGRLRGDSSNFTSWLKSKNEFDPNLLKTILVGHTENEMNVSQMNIPSPQFVGEFSYTFWLKIDKWYDNFKYWKHVWHRGKPVDYTINYTQWDDIEKDYDIQLPGVWLAPYTNNLRICYTIKLNKTKKRGGEAHSNVQICLDENGIDVRQSNKEPISCYTTGMTNSRKNIEVNKNAFQITKGICTDSVGNYTNYDEYNNISLDECKTKCANDEYCQGFSQDNRRPYYKLYGIDKSKSGTDVKSIITGGNEGVYNGDKYTCYKKIIYKNPLNDKETMLDYIDIPNIPVNKNIFIGIVFKKNMVEIYFDGKLKTTKNIDGEVSISSGDLYVKNKKTYSGYIKNLSYIPGKIEYNMIKQYYNEKPN